MSFANQRIYEYFDAATFGGNNSCRCRFIRKVYFARNIGRAFDNINRNSSLTNWVIRIRSCQCYFVFVARYQFCLPGMVDFAEQRE